MFFNRKKEIAIISMNELTQLVDSHSGLMVGMNARIGNIELEIEKLKTHIISLRGLMNRKLGNTEAEEETQSYQGVLGLEPVKKNK